MIKQFAVRRSMLMQGMFVCLLAALLFHFSQTGYRLSNKVLDRQFALLHDRWGNAVANDVVVVGIDEAAFKALREPFALWHPHLGNFLQALAVAKPAVVGLDIALPERSYQFLAPKYDQLLLQGLQALRAQSPLVVAQKLDHNGMFRPVYPALLPDTEVPASVVVCMDADGVARRFDPNSCTVNAQGTTLVERMAAQAGIAHGDIGLIDFNAGDRIEYIPFLKVLEWWDRKDAVQLTQSFAGKMVLLGLVGPEGASLNVPVPLAAWEPNSRDVPEVLVQAQVLRSMLSGGLIREVDAAFVLGLTMLAALFWLGRVNWIKLALLAGFPFMLLSVSTWLLGRGWYLPIGGILLSGVFAFSARLIYEAIQHARQRDWLRLTFGSYVSPEVLREIMAGNIRSGAEEARRMRLTVLFADIHGFGVLGESSPPQEVVDLLNEYFSEMTVAIHQHRGTVDKFVGDGIMALFGAPLPLECPERSALEAAQEMLLRLRQVNARLHEMGREPIEIGIAVHVGEAVIGHIGSELRHEYTAIGNVVSLTESLEGLTRTLGYPIVCSADVARMVDNIGGLVDCGEQTVKGAPLKVYGWTPPLLAAS